MLWLRSAPENVWSYLDLDLISNEMIIEMRDRPKNVRWAKRMKDAGEKAAKKRNRTLAARKAVETRKRNQMQRADLKNSLSGNVDKIK